METETDRKVPDGWKIVADSALNRTYQFDNFIDAFALVTKIALIAEHRKHHPDITFGYNYVNVAITTHSAGYTLTSADYRLAEEINKVCESENTLYVLSDLHDSEQFYSVTRNLTEALEWKNQDAGYRRITATTID